VVPFKLYSTPDWVAIVILPVDTARRGWVTLEAVGIAGGNGTALIIVAEEEFATQQVLSTVFLTNKV
jgi:hypothetical protein